MPKAITGTPFFAQIRTTSWMSAVSCAITTASGGCDGQPRGGMGMLLAHRLRGDQPVAEPRRQRVDGALQRLRFRPLQIACYRCRHVKIPPGFGGRWQRIYKGSRTRLTPPRRDDDFSDRRPGHQTAGRPVRVLGDADRAAMDRLQRPSQHGLLQRDDGPRDRRAVAAARHRAGLQEGAPRLDLHRRMPCALFAGNSSWAIPCR